MHNLFFKKDIWGPSTRQEQGRRKSCAEQHPGSRDAEQQKQTCKWGAGTGASGSEAPEHSLI